MIDLAPANSDGRQEPTGDLKVRLLIAILPIVACACTPTVRLAAPTEPITINLNVKIDQEVRVKLDKEVEDLITSNPDLF